MKRTFIFGAMMLCAATSFALAEDGPDNNNGGDNSANPGMNQGNGNGNGGNNAGGNGIGHPRKKRSGKGSDGGSGGGDHASPGASVSPEQCAEAVNKLTPIGHQCNTLSDFGARSQCFNNAPQSAGVDPGTMDGCEKIHGFDALKGQLKAEQQSKYPDQGDALESKGNSGNNGGNGQNNNKRPGKNRNAKGPNGPGNGNNGQGGGNNGGQGNNNGPVAQVTAEQCAEVINKLTPVGHQCNTISDFNARSQCFNNAPQSAGVDRGVMNGCEQNHSLDGLKTQLQAEQKSKYPDQGDALESNSGGGNGGNNNNGSGNGGPNGGNNRQHKGRNSHGGNGGPGNNGPGNGNNGQGGGNNGPGNGNNGQGGGNNGGQGNNNGPVAQVTAEQCAEVINKLTPVGHQCNTISDFNARSQCFNNAPQSAGVDRGVMNGCEQNHSLDGLKPSCKLSRNLSIPTKAML